MSVSATVPEVTHVLLDVNETLFALGSVRRHFEDAGLYAQQVPRWFATVLRDGFAAASAGRFAAFPDIAAHHARELARAADLDDPDAVAEEVIAAFEEVTPHPDVAEALTSLASDGVTVATFTNGTTAVTEQFLERAGLSDQVAATLDVSGAGVWKPHPDAYRYALAELGADAETTAMVAVHPWDVQGGVEAGLVGAWVNREGTTYPGYFAEPTVEGPDLVAVASRLVGH